MLKKVSPMTLPIFNDFVSACVGGGVIRGGIVGAGVGAIVGTGVGVTVVCGCGVGVTVVVVAGVRVGSGGLYEYVVRFRNVLLPPAHFAVCNAS